MPFHALQMTDGSVAILQTVGDAQVEACLAKWPARESARIVRRMAIDPTTVPADRTFRNAWVLATVPSPTTWPRRARSSATSSGASGRRCWLPSTWLISAPTRPRTMRPRQRSPQKQALRDAPSDPAIDGAKTPEELKAITLATLAAAALD